MAAVLPEGPDGSGWTDNYIRVEVADADAVSGVVPVRLGELTDVGMRGTLAPQEPLPPGP